jgi:hypothetical protein
MNDLLYPESDPESDPEGRYQGDIPLNEPIGYQFSMNDQDDDAYDAKGHVQPLEPSISELYEALEYPINVPVDQQYPSLSDPYESAKLVNSQDQFMNFPLSEYKSNRPNTYLEQGELSPPADKYPMKSEYRMKSEYPVQSVYSSNSEYPTKSEYATKSQYPVKSQFPTKSEYAIKAPYLMETEYPMGSLGDSDAWLDRRVHSGYDVMGSQPVVFPDISRWRRSADKQPSRDHS